MSEIEIISCPRPEMEPKYWVPESYKPRWTDGEFKECGGCRVKLGSPVLCNWCLYVREREPKEDDMAINLTKQQSEAVIKVLEAIEDLGGVGDVFGFDNHMTGEEMSEMDEDLRVAKVQVQDNK